MTEENILARYTIQRELGRGTLGAVYAARDRTTGAIVALKRLDPALLKSDASLAERFLQHTRAARRLEHANIVRILDAGAAAGTGYVAMELLEGRSLRSLLDEGPLPVARAIRIARDVASGLAHAHLAGVVHGGIKPSNIMVLPSGAVKITDFGIAQLGQAVTPEQMQGGAVDHRSDLFALGALLYEMLAHRPPFEGRSPKEIMDNILHAEQPLPSQLNPLVPRALDRIVFSMLAVRPQDRLPGAPILLRDLERIEEALGVGGVEDRVPAQEAPRFAPTERDVLDHRRAMMERESRQRRSAIVPALALVVAVLALGLAGFMYYSSQSVERPIVAKEGSKEPAPARPPEAPKAVAEVQKPVPETPKVAPEAPVVPEAPREPATMPAAQAAPAQELPRAAQPAVKEVQQQPAAEVAEPQPAGTAQLILAVEPRGEIYVDGEHRGTTPPLTTLDLEPGMHRIEVRSGARRPFLTYMTVEPGDVRRIRHDFNAKPSRPPA